MNIIDRLANIFCETTSVNIASKRSGLQPVDLQFLREKVGKPTTQVTLPSSEKNSTKSIDSNSMQHGTNNKLGANSISTKLLQDGMVSNRVIDFT